MDWITTSTLLHDLRDFGNAAAWQRFVARFRKPLVSFGRQAGLSPADAQDLAQETLAAFADSMRKGTYDRQKGKLSTWLFGIAYKHLLRQRRKVGRDALGGHSDESTTFWANVPDERSATDMWDREWEASLIQQCVDQARNEFPQETFQLFELVVLNHRSPRDVAENLGVAVKTVYDAKYRVLKRVRDLRAEYEDVE